MPSYKFVGAYARFYPQERDANGHSLMAELGDVHDWAEVPSDGQWLPCEDEPAEPVREPEPAPAPDQPVPAVTPLPEVITPEAPVDGVNAQVSVPENPAPEPVSPPAPEVAPEPVAVPAEPPARIDAMPSGTWTFPGFAPASQPSTR